MYGLSEKSSGQLLKPEDFIYTYTFMHRCVNGIHEGKAVEKQLVYMETPAQSG